MTTQLILLSCTVEPSKDVLVARSDMDLRLNDYVEAITKWLDVARRNNHKILVVENSENLNAIRNRLGFVNYPHIYFLATSKDLASQKEGISAGEFAMLREALPFIESLPEIKFCWKVTGRLFVENFEKISESNSSDIVVNRFYRPFHIVDSRFIGISIAALRDLVSLEPKFRKHNKELPFNYDKNTYSSLEEFLTFFVTQRECVRLDVGAMRKIPIFSGTSASTNKKLNSRPLSLKLQVLNSIRPMVLKLLGGSAP